MPPIGNKGQTGEPVPAEKAALQKELGDVLSLPLGRVTSRDDIIDPYSIVDVSKYGTSNREQARYNADLARAKLYAERQEALYQEWYESPEQVAARERAAGRNPDLIDGALSSGEASSVEDSSQSPMAGIESAEEVSARTIQSVIGIVGTMASIASLPSSIGASIASIESANSAKALTDAQTVSQNLLNIGVFEKGVFDHVSGLLANASQSAVDNGDELFDPAVWLADPANLAGVYESFSTGVPLSQSSQYLAAYNRAISNVQKLSSSSYGVNADAAQNKSSFARLMANPYSDPSVVFQVASLEPVMLAEEKIRLLGNDLQLYLTQNSIKEAQTIDPVSLAGVKNAENKYKTAYFNGFSGDKVAAVEYALKCAEEIIIGSKADVLKNYRAMYNAGPDTINGLRGAYMVLNRGELPWQEFMVLNTPELLFDGMEQGKKGLKILKEKWLSPVPDDEQFTDDYVREQFYHWSYEFQKRGYNPSVVVKELPFEGAQVLPE